MEMILSLGRVLYWSLAPILLVVALVAAIAAVLSAEVRYGGSLSCVQAGVRARWVAEEISLRFSTLTMARNGLSAAKDAI